MLTYQFSFLTTDKKHKTLKNKIFTYIYACKIYAMWIV